MSEDTTSQQLKRLVTRFGTGVLDEPRRLEGLLRDYCPGDKRGVTLLMSALQENIPRDLMAIDVHVPVEITAARLVRRMVDNRGLSNDAAGWCVEAWAHALGIAYQPVKKTPPVIQPVPSPFAAAPESARQAAGNAIPSARIAKGIAPVVGKGRDYSRIYLVAGVAGGLGLIIFLGWIVVSRLYFKGPSPEAIKYYQDAETARQQGKNTIAAGLYDKAIVSFTGYRQAILGRGKTLLAMGKKDEALADFNRAIEMDPKDADGYFQRGLYYVESKDDQNALADFSKAVELKADWAEPYFRRGTILDKRSEWAEALKDYNQALDLNYQPAKDIYLQRGIIYSYQGNLPGAVDEYNAVIDLDPQNAQAYYLRGMARADLLDLKGAIEDLNHALELNPRDEGIYYRRGLVYDRMGEDEKAIADYSEAIKLNDKNPGVFYKRGILFNRLEKFDEAINDFTTVIRLGSDQQMIFDAYLARSYTHARKGDLERAVYDAGKTTELDAQNPEGWNSLCWLGSLAGKAADVIPACEKAVTLAPTNGNYRDSRGVARAMKGDYGGAIEDFKAFLAWQESRGGSEEDRSLRKGWVTALTAGENPFTEDVITRLLRQEAVFLSGESAKKNSSGTASQTNRPPECREIGRTWVSPTDNANLMCVPAGDYLMGSKAMDAIAYPNEVPQHTVYLDAFWMDVHEVTNAMYAKCVQSGLCLEPIERISQYRDAQFEDFPVVVPWEQARSYCSWAGRRLPAEAEWEKAGRGDTKNIYPWGDLIDCSHANYSGCAGDPVAVGSYPDAASPYGMLDMAGNVWEWVSDWYSEGYYRESPRKDPGGPETGERHVLRGGAWDSYDINLRTAFRNGNAEGSHGFRCLWSENTQK